jgi:hypothetical protein
MIWVELTLAKPTPTIPAPIREPTIVCVPEIGNPIAEDNIIKPKAQTFKNENKNDTKTYSNRKHHALD